MSRAETEKLRLMASDSEGATDLPRVGEPSAPPEVFGPLVLEKLDENLFRGPKENLWRPTGSRGVFGGQVLALSLRAAIESVPKSKVLHSMHSYFLRAGKETQDIILAVMSLRNGRSFATRLVTAQQSGLPIFVLIASFQVNHPASLNFQVHAPMVPAPDSLPTETEYIRSLLDDPRCPDSQRSGLEERLKRPGPFEMRRVLTFDMFEDDPPLGWSRPEYPKLTKERKQIVWMKTQKPLGDDEDLHRSVVAYASDMNLLGTARGTIPIYEIAMVASLDHSMWFFSPFRMDDWMLYVMESPRVNNARGLAFGNIFRRDGVLAVAVSQEGLLRLRRDAPSKPSQESKL